MLLAFDLQQPWACHQSYRLFDELHSEIFGRPEVTASRIVVLDILLESIRDVASGIKNQPLANYRLTEYFMMYLMRQALEIDEDGRTFVADPGPMLDKLTSGKLFNVFRNVLADLVIDLNGELEERAQKGDLFDYKRELKSPVAVRRLATEIMGMYQKGVRRGKSSSFSGELEVALAK